MKIYTKAGDEGSTGRGDGVRVRKSDALIAAVGGVDETNAAIGLCLAACGTGVPPVSSLVSAGREQTEETHGRDAHATHGQDGHATEIREALEPLQPELFRMGAVIAACGRGKGAAFMVDKSAILRMEAQIDKLSAVLPALEHFVLPRGTELACRLHVARTSCRRAERAIVTAADAGMQLDPLMFEYINRLSDLLFTLARFANFQGGVNEVQWP
jgi:cob(I)alamin adenosyltransferase